jgi:hypothetical protein
LTPTERLAALYVELTHRGLPCLVMGGHAVRYYGVERTTIDYDFHLALDLEAWRQLPQLLRGPGLLEGCREEHSWRPEDFRRFAIGTLPDGRLELLECWRRNHLLGPFAELHARREEGLYGGRLVAFLGLADLIRSKETEREDDWADVGLLEEISDQRALAVLSLQADRIRALSCLRSRRGYERARRIGLLDDGPAVAAARDATSNPVTLAYLAPHAPTESRHMVIPVAVNALLDGPVSRVEAGSARHLALVEAVRRLFKRAAMEADRIDKERTAGLQD